MGAEDNLATVKGIYEAFGSGDMDAILAPIADDVDWAAETTSRAAPWYEPIKGKDGVPSFFQALGALEVSKFDPVAFTTSENEVMVRIEFGFTVTATGKSGSFFEYHYWRFNDEGKVDMWRGTEDTAQTEELLKD